MFLFSLKTIEVNNKKEILQANSSSRLENHLETFPYPKGAVML